MTVAMAAGPMARRPWLLAAAVVVLAALPGVQGQAAASTFRIDAIDAPAESLVPNGAAAAITIHWTYSSPDNLAGSSGATPTLVWTQPACAGDNGGLLLTGSLTQNVSPTNATLPSRDVHGTSRFSAMASQQAPGETPISCTFTGRVQGALAPANASGDTAPATDATTLQVAFAGPVIAIAEATIQEAGPGHEIAYRIRLTNAGNALANVRFVVSSADDGWIAQAPVQVQVGSLQQGAASNEATAVFVVTTPSHLGWNNAEQGLTLRVTSFSTKDQDLTGNVVSFPLLARVRGCVGPCVPGLPALTPYVVAALLVGGGVAVVGVRKGLRRRPRS